MVKSLIPLKRCKATMVKNTINKHLIKLGAKLTIQGLIRISQSTVEGKKLQKSRNKKCLKESKERLVMWNLNRLKLKRNKWSRKQRERSRKKIRLMKQEPKKFKNKRQLISLPRQLKWNQIKVLRSKSNRKVNKASSQT